MPGFLTISEAVRAHGDRCADEARRLYKAAVRPIYRRSLSGRPVGIGSSVLVQIRGELCLATAAHVLDGHESAGLFFGGAPDFIPLNLTFATTVPPDGDRKADHVDVALAILPPEFRERLAAFPFIPETVQIRDVQPSPTTLFLAMGFRASQSKEPRPGVTELSPRIFTYKGLATAVPDADRRQSHGLDNFALEYGKNGRRHDGAKVRLTPPQGVSGGAIFSLGDVGDIEQIAAERPVPKLAGLLIECSTSGRALIGTKMQALYDCFEDASGGT